MVKEVKWYKFVEMKYKKEHWGLIILPFRIPLQQVSEYLHQMRQNPTWET